MQVIKEPHHKKIAPKTINSHVQMFKMFFDWADVQQDGDTWLSTITDEGEDNKRVKPKAGRRKVPLHSELIRLDFLDFGDSRRNGTRLFPDDSYSANSGCRRNLGRWCNESFLPKLGVKQPGLLA